MGEILSMTGYGSAKGVVAGQELTVELKSVNNRYLDCSVRLPRSLLFAEEAVKQAVSASVNRGKVDVFVSCASGAEAGSVVRVNNELARSYFGIRLTFGVGAPCNSPLDLRLSAAGARSALDYRVLLGAGQPIYIGDLEWETYPDLNDEFLLSLGEVVYNDGRTIIIQVIN